MSTKGFFRFLFILGCLFIVATLVAGFIEPKDVSISRSLVIQAPKEVVFDQMVHFKNWPNWSPWARLDSTMKNSFSDNDGQPGSTFHWVGDERKTGEVIIKNMAVNGSAIDFQFDLIKPSQSTFKGTLKAEDSAGATKATFVFTTHFDYPWNAMVIFMNLDKTLSKDLINALDNMKLFVEKGGQFKK